MRKLPAVEEAKEIMRQGMEWSVVRWLKEKKRVRRMSDRANEVLDELDREVKATWPPELREAYAALSKANGARHGEQESPASELAQRIKRADDSAARARAQAEKTFDQAEDELSARLAREGSLQAIQSWELHEQAIRLSELGSRAKQPQTADNGDSSLSA